MIPASAGGPASSMKTDEVAHAEEINAGKRGFPHCSPIIGEASSMICNGMRAEKSRHQDDAPAKAAISWPARKGEIASAAGGQREQPGEVYGFLTVSNAAASRWADIAEPK